jgi:hypothetical protein
MMDICLLSMPFTDQLEVYNCWAVAQWLKSAILGTHEAKVIQIANDSRPTQAKSWQDSILTYGCAPVIPATWEGTNRRHKAQIK